MFFQRQVFKNHNKKVSENMWKYIKKYLPYAVLAAMFMVGEVLMDLLQPEILSEIVDNGVLGINNNGVGDLGIVWKNGIIMIVLVLFGGLCGAMNNVFVQMTGQNIGNDMRKDCFRSIMAFSFSQIDRFGTGSLITRITNDITQVQNLVSQFVRGMVRTSMLMFGSIYFMFRLNFRFGLVVLCAFPCIVCCIIVCLHKASPLFSKLQNQLDKVNSIMQEDISGIRIIKACVKEIHEKIRFGKANDELIKTQLRVLIIFAFMNPIMNAMMYVVVLLILVIGSFEVSSGAVSPGTIMAGITYTTQLLNGIMMLVMLFQNISCGAVSWKRIKEILNSQPQLKNGSFSGVTKSKGKIEFRNVSFSYEGSNHVILKNIDLTITPGETVAIMGATGSGKSSLVNLIPRFYDISKGSVLVDGVDVREYDQTVLREKIAFVLQKSELFSRSIQENISWGDSCAELPSIQKAASIAQADDFILSTANGYDTLVAERGMSLSGGQKQRISIARAILKKAEILIFDDSTSALDLKTEANLYNALRESAPHATKIIIAQRIASVRQADRIVVLEDGQIVSVGSHAELIAGCKTYRDIYDSQMGEESDING